jgi:hypothetical protein
MLTNYVIKLGMTAGRIRVGYNKYPPATVPAGISHTGLRPYPWVLDYTRTRRVSGRYRVPVGVYIYIYINNTKNYINNTKKFQKI